jgi:SEC-C motif-containing protein
MNFKDLENKPCPCGSKNTYSRCCELLHKGSEALSAEALMRSRFSGFVLRLNDYLLASWHPSTRPKQIEFEEGTQWKRLEILNASNNTHHGSVHFKAYYQEQQQWHLLEETSEFVFEKGHWLYHSGNYQPHQLNPNRNDGCPCGSGKKFKKCCL